MSDSADTSFRVDDLLVSIDASDATGDQLVSGTVVRLSSQGIIYWPAGGVLVCGAETRGDVTAGSDDPPLLAGVKALLRGQIAELEAQSDGSPTGLVSMNATLATALEEKLSDALHQVQRLKAGLDGDGG